MTYFMVEMFNADGVNELGWEVTADSPQAAREQAERDLPGYTAGTATPTR